MIVSNNDEIKKMDMESVVRYFPEIFDRFSYDSGGKYVFLCHIPEDISIWSKAAVDYFDMPGVIMYDVENKWIERIAPWDQEKFSREMEKLRTGEIEDFELDYHVKNKYGKYVTCTGTAHIICDESGPKYMTGSILNHEVNYSVDPTTGLYNRSMLMKAITEKCENKTPFHLFIVGIRNFFEINSSHGYLFGNKVLKAIAEYAITMRSTGMLYRVEGTKYVYLTNKEDASEEELKAVFREYSDHLGDELIVDGRHLTVDVNGANLTVNNFNIDTNSIYNSALYVLQKAKEDNLQELLLVDENYFVENERHLKLLNEIRNSVAEGCRGFFLLYQPIIDVNTKKITGAEALIRWRDKEGNVIPPNDFIPWLEQDPIYYELGVWILQRVMQETKGILKLKPGFVVNVNLAYPQIQRGEFVSHLREIIEEEEFPTKNIKLELTERCRLLNVNNLRNTMIQIKTLGIDTALDDFGTGYSALNLLVDLPIDQIKIDKSLVDGIEEDVNKQSLLRALTNSAYELGKAVCVEGVETGHMAIYLKENFYITQFQGYYFSKPIEISKIPELDFFN
ncbi:MAG: GGDEF domain-containing phosphodiesterase [Lachnospiraceae bacterium]|nr:GGDEF domain-containing phosphodiesterase [Lachnospiraceae bacterium]